MGGLARICKIYGGLIAKDSTGTAEWVYDYIQDKPRLKKDMTEKELRANEKFKYKMISQFLTKI